MLTGRYFKRGAARILSLGNRDSNLDFLRNLIIEHIWIIKADRRSDSAQLSLFLGARLSRHAHTVTSTYVPWTQLSMMQHIATLGTRRNLMAPSSAIPYLGILNSEQAVMTSRQPPLNAHLIQVLRSILHILGRLIHKKRTRVGSRPHAAFISPLPVTQQVAERGSSGKRRSKSHCEIQTVASQRPTCPLVKPAIKRLFPLFRHHTQFAARFRPSLWSNLFPTPDWGGRGTLGCRPF